MSLLDSKLLSTTITTGATGDMDIEKVIAETQQKVLDVQGGVDDDASAQHYYGYESAVKDFIVILRRYFSEPPTVADAVAAVARAAPVETPPQQADKSRGDKQCPVTTGEGWCCRFQVGHDGNHQTTHGMDFGMPLAESLAQTLRDQRIGSASDGDIWPGNAWEEDGEKP